MKEQKIKNTPGAAANNKNVFVQFDQHERQRLYSAKNRYAFDFSSIWRFYNYGKLGIDTLYDTYGVPGDHLSIVRNHPGKPKIVDFLEYGDTSVWSQYTNTNTPYNVPVFYNCLGFIDATEQTVFGSTKKSNFVDFFRAGYFEITIKTNKQNQIIASGTSNIEISKTVLAGTAFGPFSIADGVSISQNAFDELSNDYQGQFPSAVNYPDFYDAGQNALINMNIEIINGKLGLSYYNQNKDLVDFTLIGNTSVADNNWHHIIINFGRPGLIKNHGTKHNNRFVEFWVDGNLDKRFNDVVNQNNLFYPVTKFLFNNPFEMISEFLKTQNQWDNYDSLTTDTYIGYEEFTNNSTILHSALQLNSVLARGFEGGVHNLAIGVNIPISKYEIQERFNLWSGNEKRFAKEMTATAELVNPVVTGNKKKALKLFWNELVDSSKFGVELDSEYDIYSYSVTHKTLNSPTDLFNVDSTSTNGFALIPNVRAAFTDNVLIYGPGLVAISNIYETFATAESGLNGPGQNDPNNKALLDSVVSVDNFTVDAGNYWPGARQDLAMSGLSLNNGDRILLTGQFNQSENGVWVFNGLNQKLTRPADSIVFDQNLAVYVEEGIYAKSYWFSNSKITSVNDYQTWKLVDSFISDSIGSSPIYANRWEDENGNFRFIDLEQDIDISKYDTIVFMNYPTTKEEVKNHFVNETEFNVQVMYENFIKSLQNVVAQGANLFVSSPKLAEDLGVVKKFTEIDQALETSDAQSAEISPFEISEPAENYFDTHRINQYQVVAEIAGLTDKETYIMTDFVNFIPEGTFDPDEYHVKYVHKPTGLKEGNAFFIPGLTLRAATNNDKIPGKGLNRRGLKPLLGVAPADIVTGTTVTTLSNNYYDGDTAVPNPYDDFATTIIVHDGQLLNGQPVAGKIFVNCVEDSFTFSRNDYNKAIIQIIPENDPSETVATRAWNYSTTRLNRVPNRIDIRALTELGQTSPTNGGGGPLVQSSTNSSNGIVRSVTDDGKINYESDLYPTEVEEIYEIEEIPTLSMTMLGLKWLAS